VTVGDDSTAAGAGSGDPPPRLFVYGSLRAGEPGPMAALLHGHARHLGAGTIRAALYAVSWYSIAAPSDETGAVVHGDLFELDQGAADEVLARLDEYEGADFVRTEVAVKLGDETSTPAEAYLCAASVAGLRRIEHGDWRREREAAAGNPLARSAESG
jgi:gamma-glutamylcyclotransferase (GGCT)/AIG2-like uncharacterized protein YtfP